MPTKNTISQQNTNTNENENNENGTVTSEVAAAVAAGENQPEAIIAALQNAEPDAIEVPENRAADFLKHRQERQKIIQDKLQLIKDIDANLTEAAKLAEQGGASEAQAFEKSQTAALKLYQGWVSGALDAPQVTEILGRKFGAKKKGDSKTRVAWASGDDASSTPFGMGEAIRKRVVRAVRAYEFVQSGGNEGVAFFDTLAVDDVRSQIEAVNNGNMTVNTLYEKLAALKTAANEGSRPNLAFDPSRLVKVTDKLGEDMRNTLETVGNSEALFNALLDLRDMINLIENELTQNANTAEAA